MASIKIKQTKSAIKRTENQKLTIKALGLGKLNRIVEHPDTPMMRGMVRKVSHLVEIIAE